MIVSGPIKVENPLFSKSHTMVYHELDINPDKDVGVFAHPRFPIVCYT